MNKKIRIYSKDGKFTVSDLSELLYNINNIYKLLVFEKEEKQFKYYFRAKLPEKDALFIDKISKESPFFIEISSAITYGDVIQSLIAIIGIAIALRHARSENRKEIKEQVIRELEKRRIKISDELVGEVTKLSKRRIRIEEIKGD